MSMPLFESAVKQGHFLEAKSLLKKNPSLAICANIHGSSPLHLAVQSGDSSLVQHVVQATRLVGRDNNTHTPLDVAILKEFTDLFTHLLPLHEVSAPEGASGSLLFSIQHKKERSLAELLIFLDPITEDQKTARLYPNRNLNTSTLFHQAILKHHRPCLDLILPYYAPQFPPDRSDFNELLFFAQKHTSKDTGAYLQAQLRSFHEKHTLTQLIKSPRLDFPQTSLTKIRL